MTTRKLNGADSNTDANRIRAFAELVSVDAWHGAFKAKTRAVDLNVQVTFNEARLGGESASRVTFRLRLKRAEVIAYTGNEPVRILRTSVYRGSNPKPAKVTMTATDEKKRVTEGSLTLSPDSPKLGVKAKKANTSKLKKTVQSNVAPREFDVFYLSDEDRNDRWIIKPAGSVPYLEGNALDQPLFRMVDTRVDANKGLPPSVRIEVKCLKEDLEILDIQLKDPGLIENIGDIMGSDKRQRVAEAYIRTKLSEFQLTTADFDNRYVRITVATVLASPE